MIELTTPNLGQEPNQGKGLIEPQQFKSLLRSGLLDSDNCLEHKVWMNPDESMCTASGMSTAAIVNKNFPLKKNSAKECLYIPVNWTHL